MYQEVRFRRIQDKKFRMSILRIKRRASVGKEQEEQRFPSLCGNNFYETKVTS